MATASTLTPQAQDIVAWFRAAFAALDDHKSQTEREAIYQTIVKHIRSAAPMSLLGGVADVVEPCLEAIVQLADGARVEVRKRDGGVEMYVVDSAAHDACVTATAGQVEEIRQAMARVVI